MTRKSLLVYIHIYKNGGSSVRELLHRLAGIEEFLDIVIQQRQATDGLPIGLGCDDPTVTEVEALVRDAADRLTYVAIDLPYGIHEIVTRPVNYCVTLRDPVDRLLSYVRFARNQDRSTVWPALLDVNFDFQLAVERRGLFAFSNDQVRMITGSRDVHLTDDHLERAKHLLVTRYAAVGTFDHLDDFGLELARMLGQPRHQIPHLNASHRGLSDFLGASRLRQLGDLNELDRRLVRWWIEERARV